MPEAEIRVQLVTSSMFAENAFIAYIEGGRDCIVVDPGSDADRIIAHIEKLGLELAAIVLTHGHADHIAGNRGLKDRWPDCHVVIGRQEASKLVDPMANLSATLGFSVTSPEADTLVEEGEVHNLAGIDFQVLETPGHSAGHVVYVCKGASPWFVFCGDVIFEGSVGRSDFPDSNPQDLYDSIRSKLYTMPEDTILWPGHGDSTTVGREKRTNPFVRG